MKVGIGIKGIALECEVNTWKETKGRRDSYGCPEEPDEPAGFEVEGITISIDAVNLDDLVHITADAVNKKVAEALAEKNQEPDFDEDEYITSHFGHSRCASYCG